LWWGGVQTPMRYRMLGRTEGYDKAPCIRIAGDVRQWKYIPFPPNAEAIQVKPSNAARLPTPPLLPPNLCPTHREGWWHSIWLQLVI
jgi:hypothetical protein